MCVHGRNVGVIARGTAGGREPVGLFFAIDFVVHLPLKCYGIYLVRTRYAYTSSQLAWWRTVSLGTYCYCCSGVLVNTYSSVVVLFFFVSAVETLIVVACHVLYVTTVWISENELRESINIYSRRAEVQQKSSYSPTMTS